MRQCVGFGVQGKGCRVREGPWNDKSAGDRLAMIAVLLFLFPGFRVQGSGFGNERRETDYRCRGAHVSSAPPKCNVSLRKGDGTTPPLLWLRYCTVDFQSLVVPVRDM